MYPFFLIIDIVYFLNRFLFHAFLYFDLLLYREIKLRVLSHLLVFNLCYPTSFYETYIVLEHKSISGVY